MMKDKLTFILNCSLYARLTCPTKRMAAYKFEILSYIVHLLFLQVRDDDEYFIASGIVHAS